MTERHISNRRRGASNGPSKSAGHYVRRFGHYLTHTGALSDRLFGRSGLFTRCALDRAAFSDKPLKVLHLALTPLAGAPIRLSRLLETSPDISSILVSRRQWYDDGRAFAHDIVYETGSLFNNRGAVRRLIDECDLVHFHNEAFLAGYGVFRGLPDDKPWCVQWHSGPDHIAAQAEVPAESLVAFDDWPTLVVAQKQARFYPSAAPVPNAIDIRAPELSPAERPADRLDVCYAHTDPPMPTAALCGDKGQAEVLPLLQKLRREPPPSLRVHIIQGVPLDQCLRIKRRCHVCIDDVKSGGYHLNSLEALSVGSVAVAHLDEQMRSFLCEFTGCTPDELPWLDATADTLETCLRDLAADPERVRELGRRSRRWMETCWNPGIVIGHYRDAYNRVLNTRPR
ncbi:MAG: hypothetical protein ACOC8E_01125 [Planctomycetota bacterium]